jgi:hypothetical protein
MTNLERIFIFSLLIALLISFYFFISHMVLKDNKHYKIFTTWQFPMLFAIFVDAIYNFC